MYFVVKHTGVRPRVLEVYVKPEHAEEAIAISKSFGVEAQVVGRVEAAEKNELIIESPYGTFKY
jgi:phosphoribosylformylglycinamidine cyclo-ligase